MQALLGLLAMVGHLRPSHGKDTSVGGCSLFSMLLRLEGCSGSCIGEELQSSECEATDSRAMGIATLWYHRGETSIESSIPCSQGGRVHGCEKGSRRLGPQCDPQFCKAQRNRETTFLRLEFRADGAGDEGGLDFSQETFFCSGVCHGKFLPCMGCHVADICRKMTAKRSDSEGSSKCGGRRGQQRRQLWLCCDFVAADYSERSLLVAFLPQRIAAGCDQGGWLQEITVGSIVQRGMRAAVEGTREVGGKTCIVRYIIGPTADRYADRPLPGGTAKIDRRRSISATPLGGRPQVVAARVARGFFLPHAGRPNVSPCGREFEATAIRNCAYRPVPVPYRYRQNVDTPVQTVDYLGPFIKRLFRTCEVDVCNLRCLSSVCGNG
ncbi:hypothetical protein BHM03_00014535 [Ensete ventricosum]|uniref:Uncharacterized protein n=1 Tax=Ensete ventricosum TaxID=4639 RepID=A0A445ME56_ENSVE|nr:hypothetical protein BHM03_00014535 [Ensete ventricosum]